MIKGYRFVSGHNVSRLFRTAAKAKREAGLSGMNYPLFVVRDTGQRCYCELFVRTSPAAEWSYMRNGLNRGPVTAGAAVYRDYSDRFFKSRPFEVCVSLWGEDFNMFYAAKPSRRQIRAGIKSLKAWYLEFHGEPIAEGE